VVAQLECVALLACTHWSPHVRSVGVDIVHAVHHLIFISPQFQQTLSVISLLNGTDDDYTSLIHSFNYLFGECKKLTICGLSLLDALRRVSDVWDIESLRILQYARYHFLLQLTGGIEKDIRLSLSHTLHTLSHPL
jgi:hypothetical protein